MNNQPAPKKVERTPGEETSSEQVTAPKPAEAGPASELTAEEQMARYEEELKENDWGHQPC